jgi:hypothetical protein
MAEHLRIAIIAVGMTENGTYAPYCEFVYVPRALVAELVPDALEAAIDEYRCEEGARPAFIAATLQALEADPRVITVRMKQDDDAVPKIPEGVVVYKEMAAILTPSV